VPGTRLPLDDAAATRSDEEAHRGQRPDSAQKSVRFADEREAATSDAAVSRSQPTPSVYSFGLLMGARPSGTGWLCDIKGQRALAGTAVTNRLPRSPSTARCPMITRSLSAPEALRRRRFGGAEFIMLAMTERAPDRQ